MNQKDRKENGALPPETGQPQTEPAGAVQTETGQPGTVVNVTVNDDATTTVYEGHTGEDPGAGLFGSPGTGAEGSGSGDGTEAQPDPREAAILAAMDAEFSPAQDGASNRPNDNGDAAAENTPENTGKIGTQGAAVSPAESPAQELAQEPPQEPKQELPFGAYEGKGANAAGQTAGTGSGAAQPGADGNTGQAEGAPDGTGNGNGQSAGTGNGTGQGAGAGQVPGQMPGAPAPRDMLAEFTELTDAHPELRGPGLSDEILTAIRNSNGRTALRVYESMMLQKQAERIASLENEIAMLRQNAEAAIRAPVTGSAGIPAAVEPEDPFLKGFNSYR